jgi:hypothetical protein
LALLLPRWVAVIRLGNFPLKSCWRRSCSLQGCFIHHCVRVLVEVRVPVHHTHTGGFQIPTTSRLAALPTGPSFYWC